MDHEQDDTAEAIERAAALSDEGEWTASLAELQARIPDDPDNPALLCAAGLAARNAGLAGVAHDYFRRCVELDPDDPILLATAGSGLAVLDDPEAERVLRLAALSAPDVPEVRLLYGSYLAEEGLAADAVRELEAARELAPDNPEVRAELGVAYLLAERPDDAVAELASAAEGGWVGAGWTETLRSLALLRAGRTEEAAHLLAELAPESLDDLYLQLMAALAYASQGWEEGAEDALAAASVVATAADAPLLDEVEDAMRAGAAEALEFLTEQLAPGELSERLRSRF